MAVVSFLFMNQQAGLSSENYSLDIESVREKGKLTALTDFNSTDYFIYKGEPMGFTYEMLKLFSRHIGVRLEIVNANNTVRAVEMLRSGEVDLLAIGLPVNPGIESVRFCESIEETRKVLVKRKDYRKPEKGQKYCDQMREQLGLGKNAVYIQPDYMDYKSLMSVASFLGDTISALEVPYEPEKLIRYVAEGIIDYTICDENLALVNSGYYPGIDVNTPVGPRQKVAWAVRESSDSLLTEINNWISSYKETREFALLYAKYFRNSRSGIIVRSDYYANNTGKISGYDEIIKKYSSTTDWDWRLIASIICQESRFNPSVTSRAGAYGLMQIMPATAEDMGIDITSSPDNNIIAGLKYLDRLHAIFDARIPDEKERVKFILASYNAGPGHVLDAMRLAEKNGMDPARWDRNVELWLLKKSEKEHYTDSVVNHGYFTGVESVNFVSGVLDRYNHYRNVLP